MKNYDVVIPLGEFCATAIALRDCGIRKASYPFDWSAGRKYDICGNCGFIGKVRMICDDFKDAFNLEDLSEFWTAQSRHRSILNNKTGLQYLHDFEWNKSVQDFYPEWLDKYQRRVKRMYDDINNSNKILFVFVTRAKHILTFNEIRLGLDLLNTKFPDKDIDFLWVQDSYDCDDNEIKYFRLNNHVHTFLYKDDASLGDGKTNVLKRIFSEFINGEVEYNFSTDSIKNYGLSVKENCGRWSNGNDVYMAVPLGLLGGGNIMVHFDAWPYIVDQHPIQDIDVFIGDEKIANWYWELGKDAPNQTLKIPANKIQGENLILHFHIKNPVSPQELGRGQDDRKLGIRFESVKITAVQPDQD